MTTAIGAALKTETKGASMKVIVALLMTAIVTALTTIVVALTTGAALLNE